MQARERAERRAPTLGLGARHVLCALACGFGLVACGMQPARNVDDRFRKAPATLQEAFVALDGMLPASERLRVRCSSEEEMIQYHMTLGLWMRNSWGLWAGSRLARWFNAAGIHHPDDMSGIIINSYWRRAHRYPLDLEEQVAHYRAWWACIASKRDGQPCTVPERRHRPPRAEESACLAAEEELARRSR